MPPEIRPTGLTASPDHPLAEALVLDELFDLTLYRELHRFNSGGLKKILGELIPVETAHLKFWQEFFGVKREHLDFGRRVKLAVLVAACRLFGANAVHLVLEAIEIYGIRKYLAVWETYRDEPLGKAVREILTDEFKHEDAIVSQLTERKISPERVRSIFLGFNDGLVEILGAVSGFFAAFQETGMVLMASCTVAVAGCLSMAAGAYVAASSEKEVGRIESGKARFLGKSDGEGESENPLVPALIVGVSYFIGAMVPVLPVLFGARALGASLLAAGVMVVLVSTVLGFLSGMAITKRVLLNLAMIAAAVGITYGIGILTKRIWGVSL